jgi:hypothetical protein
LGAKGKLFLALGSKGKTILGLRDEKVGPPWFKV